MPKSYHQVRCGIPDPHFGRGSAAAGLWVVRLVLAPVPLEVPARHRLQILAASALEVLVPLSLAGHLFEIPVDPAPDLEREGRHRDLPEVASLRSESSYSRTARLS